MEQRAFYTGTMGQPGHYFWITPRKSHLYTREIMADVPDFIECWAKMWDGGLLKNGKRPDRYDGKVFAVPAKGPWTAFVWWDKSDDARNGSNSAFYVSGFEWADRAAALAFAMEKWPQVITRQRHPLSLQAI